MRLQGGEEKDTLLLPAKTGYCFGGDSKRKRPNYSLVVRDFSVYLRKCRAMGGGCGALNGGQEISTWCRRFEFSNLVLRNVKILQAGQETAEPSVFFGMLIDCFIMRLDCTFLEGSVEGGATKSCPFSCLSPFLCWYNPWICFTQRTI